jgi:hypothetical protein
LIVGKVRQASPFCPNIAATPDGSQVWFTLKDTGKTQVFDARPPFSVLRTLDTGPITNHVNFVRNAQDQFAYITVGGLNEVQVFRTDDFSKVATIQVGKLPNGIWPSGDGSRSLFNKREWPCHLFKSLTLGGHAKAQLHCGRSDHEDRAQKIAAEDAGTGSGFD